MGEQASGRYLFAVARGSDLPKRLSGRTGLRHAPLEVVTHDDLSAVVCSVDLEEFGEAALARNLEDLRWLEEVARAHNDVVLAVADHATVAPMRLVTICADDSSVRSRVQALYDDLVAALDRVEGRREWSVKVLLTPQAAESEAVAAPAPAADTAATGAGSGVGTAYLRRRREQATRRQSSREWGVRLADEVYSALAADSVAARRLPPQDPRLTGRRETMVLNAAYLVAAEDGAAFREAASRAVAADAGASIEVDGPWPPYSFATLE